MTDTADTAGEEDAAGQPSKNTGNTRNTGNTKDGVLAAVGPAFANCGADTG